MTTSAVPDEIRERVAKALWSDKDAALGWCTTHDSMAQRFEDGSIACHYLAIVETWSDDCSFVSATSAVLAVLDRDALIAMLGACPTDATESVALPRDNSGESRTRPRPIREDSARLIYQSWQHKMLEIDQGRMVYDWWMMPGDVKRAWEDVVSGHINWLYEGVLLGLADRLSVDRSAVTEASAVSRGSTDPSDVQGGP